jgi:peptidoglycan-N-acetylglucosamine deacetylase
MRKIRFLVLLPLLGACALPAGAGALVKKDPADASGPLDVARVGLGQVGRSLSFEVRTRGKLHPLVLDRDPRRSDARYLCLRLRRSGKEIQTQLCVGEPGYGKHSKLGYQKLAASGAVLKRRTVPAKLIRIDGRTLEARFSPHDADLRPHRYGMRVVSHWAGSECPSRKQLRARRARPCHDIVPNAHPARFRLRPVHPVGCVDSGPTPVRNGPRGRRVVALTFDDGPSAYTAQVLSVLKRKHARGTFFEVGQEIPGRTGTSRAILRSGSELADHSMHHENFPSRASMDETADRIQAATGFRPCLFRPPGGAYDSRVVSDAHSLGMTTVLWDVDPTDWKRPGADAIYSRVVSNTQPGSIVLMHDGGGDRSQTVAALPRIIHTLRERGYRFATVSHLLGQRTIWGSG